MFADVTKELCIVWSCRENVERFEGQSETYGSDPVIFLLDTPSEHACNAISPHTYILICQAITVCAPSSALECLPGPIQATLRIPKCCLRKVRTMR